MDNVEASTMDTFLGTGETESTGSTMLSRYAPMPSRGSTIAITASPTRKLVSVLGPTSSIFPAKSIPTINGVGSSVSNCLLTRIIVSTGFTETALTLIRTSWGPAWTSGSSQIPKTSGPPDSVIPIPRILISPRF